MGQKINPIGFRLGVNRGWDSVWFAKKKEFGKYLIALALPLARGRNLFITIDLPTYASFM
jgi:hypothetical protein